MVSKQTQKPPIIEHIFNERPKDAAGKLIKVEVTQDDIIDAIRACKAAGLAVDLSTRNPANFFKDMIRKDEADTFWPGTVFAAGYSARQITGGQGVFEFVERQAGQTNPFPNPYYPTSTTPSAKIQSVSMTIASKMLGRSDETWMTQVLVRLNLVQSHFALYSPRRGNILHIDHLQMGVKRKGAEIDALFMGVERERKRAEVYSLITFEAKKKGERIIHEQIVRQVEEAIKLSIPKKGKTKALLPSFEYIIPCGIKNMGKSSFYLVEFEAVPRTAAPPTLKRVAEMIYQIEPPIPGL